MFRTRLHGGVQTTTTVGLTYCNRRRIFNERTVSFAVRFFFLSRSANRLHRVANHRRRGWVPEMGGTPQSISPTTPKLRRGATHHWRARHSDKILAVSVCPVFSARSPDFRLSPLSRHVFAVVRSSINSVIFADYRNVCTYVRTFDVKKKKNGTYIARLFITRFLPKKKRSLVRTDIRTLFGQ